MDIKHIPGQASQQQIESGKAHKAADISREKQSQQKTAVVAEDKVEISGLAAKLNSTLATLDSVPEVNSNKVESLKNAIETGNFQVDSNSISEKLINFELSFPE